MGVVQDWITLELAIRIHNAKGYKDISEAAIRKLRVARLVLFIIVSLTFTALTVAVFVSAYRTGNSTYAFGDKFCDFYDVIGFIFLSQVLLMVFLVIWLFVETQKAVNREMKSNGRV